MANKRQGYLDKAKRQMRRRGTIGAFTEYCGGKVTEQCIERALNSNNETLRKRAQFAKNMRNLEMGGAKDQETKKLPGGIMKPIGYGAFKFMGNKHDEAGMGSDSGIILEEGGKKKPGLEVEDGELQVDVNTKDGEKEYIVSDYLINPATGNTLAEDLERELKKARNQEEADAITAKYVKLNEKLRGKEGKPEKIKAQKGTVYDEMEGEYTGGAITAEEAGIGTGELNKTGEGLFGDISLEDVKETRANNPWFDWDNFDPTSKKDVERFQKEYNKRAPEGEELVVDGKFGPQTQSSGLNKSPGEMGLKPPTAPENYVPEPGKLQVKKKDVDTPSDEPDKVKKERGPKLPYAGTPFQALGDVAGLLKNYDPNIRRMAPAYRKGPRFGRVNMDPQRAAQQQQTQGLMQSADQQGGAAGLISRMAIASQGDAGQRGIDAQESAQNVNIANQEKTQQAAADKDNVASFMDASKTNLAAGMQEDEIRRQNKMYKTELAQNIGDTAAQSIADNQQIRADFFQGQASQVDGEFDRAYQTYGPRPRFGRNVTLHPEGGTTLSPEQIQATYRNAMAEQQATQSRRGSYTSKPGKIKRKKRKR